jgi:ectoine hydroxylase-related dioxygenase (phytanoyl-CoA dioxygenase family)
MRFQELTTVYDGLMASPSGPGFNKGSTTNRLSDLLNHSSLFDDIFLYPPLLEACAHVVGEPFKLSSLLARTLRQGTPAQELHADLPRDSEDRPLFGFILMLDGFRHENGATRFVPGSHRWPDLPSHRTTGSRGRWPGEVLASGDAGTLIVFNASIWHGRTANVTEHPRRSVQGYFVRRNARSGSDFASFLLPSARTRMGQLARYLLSAQE